MSDSYETPPPVPAHPQEPGWERGVLEKLALAAIREQRAARRWKIGFRMAMHPWRVDPPSTTPATCSQF